MKAGRVPRRLHAVLRRALLTKGFERRHGASMGEVFEDAWEDTRGRGSRLGLWFREGRDLAATGMRLRRARHRHGAVFVARRRAETTTGGGGMIEIMDDIRYARRSLIRHPVFATFAILTVALGVGATAAIYSALDGVLLHPIPYANADRLVTLVRPVGQDRVFLTPVDEQITRWSEMTDVFEAVELLSRRSMTLTRDGEPTRLEVGLIRPGFHTLTGRQPILGRSFSAEELETDARVIMLGHGMWTQRFGRSVGVLGHGLDLDGEVWKVIGVMPPRSPILGFGATDVDLWRPLPPDARSHAVALMREGVSIATLNERLSVPIDRASGAAVIGRAQSLVGRIGQSMRDTLRLLMAAVVAVLMIASVNVSNLLISRANQRRRETAVRAALGGGRSRLVRQMLAEGLLLGMIGGLVGVGLAHGGLEVILSLRPAGLSALDGVTLSGRALVFSAAVTLGSSLFFSLVPAWQATRQSALAPLRSGTRNEGQGVLGRRLRWVLVSGEVALSFTLVVGAILLLGSLAKLQRTDPGFRAGEVIALDVTLPSWEFDSGDEGEPVLEAVRDRLSALPGIAHVSRSIGPPPDAGIALGTVQGEGEDPTEESQVLAMTFAGDDYFETLGQPMLQGRGFTRDEISEQLSVVVLGEGTARRFFGSTEVVAKRFRVGNDGDWSTVVGVAADVPMHGVAAGEPLQMYRPLGPRYGTNGTFLVRMASWGANPTLLLQLVREAARSVVPDARLENLGTLEERLSGTLSRERFATTLLTVFAVLALVLATVGLYGVVAQIVGQRTREIGIRMALGATRSTVRRIVLRSGAVATLFGIIVGGAFAALGIRVMSSQLFGVERVGFWQYLLAALAIGLATMVATWVPARRAARVDPVVAMRVE